MSFTDAEFIAKYIDLRNRSKQLEERQKEEMRPFKAAMETIENALHARMNASGVESIKSEHGTAYKVTNMAVKTADRNALMTYVWDNENLDMLTAAVNKEAVRAYMDASGGHPPPGVDVTFITSVNFRKS